MHRTLPLALAALLAGACVPLLGAPAAAAAAAPPAAQDASSVVWLCRPGLAEDPCEIPLDTTVREADGSERVEATARPTQDDRPVDCFYVYPTVSNQPTPAADKSVDPELRSIAMYQAAPFSSTCRVFAPVYRQATLANIAATTVPLPLPVTDQAAIRETAYADVAAAWADYLAHDNDGRGVVLLGHSQGTRMLRTLLRREIDPDPAARRLLVGAVLLGGNVVVPDGEVVGGDFAHVPLCTRPAETGCVVAFSTYAEDPPADTRFGGRPVPDDVLDLPGGPGFSVACTDPGVLSGQSGPVGITVPTEPFAPGLIAVGIVRTNSGLPPTAGTTFVRPADRFVGGCRDVAGADVLRYDPVPGSRRPEWFPEDTWGTHLIDVNYGLERQVAIVAAQAAAWQAANAPAPAAAPAAGPATPPAAGAPPGAAPAGAALPTTGGAPLLAGLAGALLGGAWLLRRRRTT